MIIELPGFKGERNKHFINMKGLNDKSIIVDVGACEGDVIKELRGYKQTRRCKIFAIECNKKLAKNLRKQNLFNVEICEKALVGQDIEGDVLFYEGRRGTNWGSIAPALVSERWKDATDIYKVKTLKINDIFDEFGIDRIDYMKMDIEASEKMIIETMSEKTAEKIKQISTEIHWKNKHTRISKERIINQLEELGFKMKIEDRMEVFCER